jgi:hypothetical protein
MITLAGVRVLQISIWRRFILKKRARSTGYARNRKVDMRKLKLKNRDKVGRKTPNCTYCITDLACLFRDLDPITTLFALQMLQYFQSPISNLNCDPPSIPHANSLSVSWRGTQDGTLSDCGTFIRRVSVVDTGLVSCSYSISHVLHLAVTELAPPGFSLAYSAPVFPMYPSFFAAIVYTY